MPIIWKCICGNFAGVVRLEVDVPIRHERRRNAWNASNIVNVTRNGGFGMETFTMPPPPSPVSGAKHIDGSFFFLNVCIDRVSFLKYFFLFLCKTRSCL